MQIYTWSASFTPWSTVFTPVLALVSRFYMRVVYHGRHQVGRSLCELFDMGLPISTLPGSRRRSTAVGDTRWTPY